MSAAELEIANPNPGTLRDVSIARSETLRAVAR
jgi:hypothetical protein